MQMRVALLALGVALAGCGGRTTLAPEQTSSQPDGSLGPDAAVSDVAQPEGAAPDAAPDATADVKGDAPSGCSVQQAQADGPCTTVLPGIKWDGQHCVPLGSGCACAGPDCEAVYETMQACVSARWACYPAPCEPQPVASNDCLNCYADTLEGYAFDGRKCQELVGCGCVGAGCASMYPSLEECLAVTSGCDAARCVATAGQWFPEQAGFCGFRCGAPNLKTCEAPFAGCLCPTGQTLVQGVGCQPDGSCGNQGACLATGGVWHPMSECYCGFYCGKPGGCDACVDSCDCGPLRNFTGPGGCTADTACGPYDEALLCMSTGGVWNDCSSPYGCSCGHFDCGTPNTLDPCVMPGCDCGWLSNFDSQLGCRLDHTCTLRTQGMPCSGQGMGSASCGPGLACCGHCGAYPGCSTCDTPCCPDSSSCQNGCYPMPP